MAEPSYGFVNSAFMSKINWTAVITTGIGAAAYMGVIPPALKQPVTEIALMLGGVATIVFRTWFTVK